MKRCVYGLLTGGLFCAVLACGPFAERAFAQFQNPLQAAKDAYNKAKAQQQAQQQAQQKAQQQAQKPASQTTQPAGAPAQPATAAAAAQPVSTQNLQVPAAPAGGIDPSKLPDIQGIHLGMTPQEMLPKLKALYPGRGNDTSQMGVSPTNVKYIHAPDQPWIGQVLAQYSPCAATGGVCSDRLIVTFSAPPNKQVAVYMQRNVGFAIGKYPTADTIIAGLKQKYGPNPVMLDARTLAWGFDENGQPLTPSPQRPQPPCGTSQTLSPNHSIEAYTANTGPLQQQELTHWITMGCGLAINVVAQLLIQDTGNGARLVGVLTVTMTENGEDIRDALAGEQYIENVNKAAQQQQLKNAQQQKVPTL